MRGWASCVLCAAIGCGGGGGSTSDARVIDAAAIADGSPDATPPMLDAMPTAVHTYYLNFEGQALTMGTDDPATNVSSAIVKATFTAPPYLMNDAQRATKIAAIVGEVQTLLAPYDITVTTTRPASGTYDMMVAGGLSQDAGLPQNVVSIVPLDCKGTGGHVVLLFEAFTLSQDEAAQQIVAMLGIVHTIPQSTKAQDCLCYANPTGCGTLSGPCTIGGAGTPVYSAQACDTTQTVMDENAEWLQVFGAHP